MRACNKNNQMCGLYYNGDCTNNTKPRLPELLKNARIDTFYGLNEVKRYKDMVAYFLSENQGLFYFGETGTGKTFLSATTYLQVFERECPRKVYWLNCFEFGKIEREPYETREESEIRYIEKLLTYEYIFLDDFSIENLKRGFNKELMYLLLDGALLNLKPKLFITSNSSISQISSLLSDRIASRLVELCKIEKSGDVDFRTTPKEDTK